MLNEGDERAQGPFADAERQRNSSPVDRLTICVYRDAPNAKRSTLRQGQPQERHAGRDGADFQLKFAEHGRKLAGMALFPPRHHLVPGATALLWQPKCKPPGAPAGPEAHPPPRVFRWCLHAVAFSFLVSHFLIFSYSHSLPPRYKQASEQASNRERRSILRTHASLGYGPCLRI